jgi:hypothetical protein
MSTGLIRPLHGGTAQKASQLFGKNIDRRARVHLILRSVESLTTLNDSGFRCEENRKVHGPDIRQCHFRFFTLGPRRFETAELYRFVVN